MNTLKSRIAQAEDGLNECTRKLTDFETRAGDRGSECETDEEVWE